MDYDSRDLVKVRTVPYIVGNTPLEIKWDYDVFGKETKFTHPDTRFRTRTYAPGLVTITNENGKIKRHFLDAYGQLTRVEEVNGAETYVTQYVYDAAGSLTSVVNHLGHYTRMKYDPVGRKEAMCDPNMGTLSNISTCTTTTTGAWVYTYFPAGDLKTQKDARRSCRRTQFRERVIPGNGQVLFLVSSLFANRLTVA
jgi:YD repeat-containing protein